MPIAMYFHPEAMSAAQYDEVMKRLDAVGQANPPGRLHHSAFGDLEHMMVYDVWEWQGSFDKFGEALMPILGELGIDPGRPAVMPVHNMVQ
jgi:hypothetical protein